MSLIEEVHKIALENKGHGIRIESLEKSRDRQWTIIGMIISGVIIALVIWAVGIK